jgi:phage tail protein X
MWAALCHLIFQCTAESDMPMTFARALYGTETRCLELVTRSPNGNEGVADLIEMVGEGRAILMPEHVPACLDALARCDRLVNSQPADAACRRVFAGTKQTGEACYREEECAGGGQCHVYDACPGICEPRPTIGEDCGYQIGLCDDSDGPVGCLSGEDVSQPPTCEAVTLLPPAGEGEPCWAFASKDRETAYCAEGLWCQGDGYFDGLEPRTGTCRGSLIPGGDPCNGWDICEEGYGCAADDVCRPFSIVGDGAPCDDLAFCDIMQRLECFEGYCRPFGDGTEGSRCVTWENIGFLPCNQGLVCVATTDPSAPEQAYACLPPLAPGESCLRDGDCASEACNRDFRCEQRFCEES